MRMGVKPTLLGGLTPAAVAVVLDVLRAMFCRITRFVRDGTSAAGDRVRVAERPQVHGPAAEVAATKARPQRALPTSCQSTLPCRMFFEQSTLPQPGPGELRGGACPGGGAAADFAATADAALADGWRAAVAAGSPSHALDIGTTSAIA
jgi:hypothetical protein